MSSGPTIVAKFLADTRKLTSEVDQATSKTGSKIQGWAKGAAVALGSAFAATKIIEFGKASVEAAASDAEAQAQLALALKNTTGATEAQIAASETFISQLSKQTAIADDDLRPALATLARGFHDTAKAQDALQLATNISAGTGKDLATVSAALSKAALGSTGALKKLGVATTNADGSAKSLDQIMSDLAKTFSGQAAAAANSTAGKIRGAKVQMGELQESIGAGLLPILSQLSGALVVILPTLSKFAPVILPLAAAFVLWSAAVSVATTVQTAFGISLGISVGWIALIVVGIAALVAGIIWAYKNVAVFRAAVDGAVRVAAAAFGFLKAAALAAFNWIKSNWPLLLAIITGPIGAAVLLVVRNWNTIRDAALAAFNWIKSNWPLLLAIITGPIGTAALLVIRNWNTIKSAATDLYNWVKGKFDALASVISGVVGGIAAAVSRVVDAIKAPINAVIGAWNSIEFRVPTIHLPEFDTHIPGIGKVGGGTVGGLTIGFPDIPKLASGAVLTGPTMFVGGEAGTELVTPEDLLRSIIREESGRASYTLNLYPRQADAADIALGFRRLELLAGVG